MIEELKPLIGKLSAFAKDRLQFKRPPRLFLKSDCQNSKKALGKTAFYDPKEESVTLFIHARHPKDILRSLAHELVHHTQNLRGDLTPDKMSSMGKNYAQDCEHMRNMEKEAYLQGNMCFRDWEDSLGEEDQKRYKLTESIYIKESKTMTTKITKEFLRETIKSVLENESKNTNKKKLGEQARSSRVTALPSKIIDNAKNVVFIWDKSKRIQAAKKVAAAAKAAGLPRSHPRIQGFGYLHSFRSIINDAIKLVGKGSTELTYGFDPDQMCVAPDIVEGLLRKGTFKVDDLYSIDSDGVTRSDPRTQWLNAKMVLAHYNANGPQEVVARLQGLSKGSAIVNPGAEIEESKIHTPEQENTLHEQRFAPKNTRLFEKLVKEWTK